MWTWEWKEDGYEDVTFVEQWKGNYYEHRTNNWRRRAEHKR